MKVIVLYRPNSEHARIVEDFIRDYQRLHDADKLEAVNVDSREGNAVASLYDIMEYPAILVTQNDGTLHKHWVGTQLPLMDEVAAYAHA